MKNRQGLATAADGTGISAPLSRQVNILGDLLGKAVREVVGDKTFELVEHLRTLCKAVYQNNDPKHWQQARTEIRDLTLEEILWVVRAFTTFFHLVNKAEQREIVRINREREKTSTPAQPRSESISKAIHYCKQNGYSIEEVLAILGRLDIQPTLTAHPTEARRRTILNKQRDIARLLEQLQRTDLTPTESEAIRKRIYEKICLLLVSDEFQAEKVSVMDEVQHGLHFITTTIWDAVPQIHNDLRRAMQLHYQYEKPLPAFLRYRSWIGGDRDGNPFITPQVTRTTLAMQRVKAIQLYQEELTALRENLSVSSRLLHIPRPLQSSLQKDERSIQLPHKTLQLYRAESFRLKLSYMIARLQKLLDQTNPKRRRDQKAFAYSTEKFLQDIDIVNESLKLSQLGGSRQLDDLRTRVMTFGFHLAALDIRQHSAVHEQAVSELFEHAGVVKSYASLSEARKIELLHRELQTSRPLVRSWQTLTPQSRDVLQTLRLIRITNRRDPQAIGAYIISMTHQVSDLLEVLLLAKEAGFWRYQNGMVYSDLELVPLFETVDDLTRTSELLHAAFSDPLYRAHLRNRNDFQEIMLGYSDSNKDGGYWMANWSLYTAQQSIAQACQQHDIDFRLFHGRGGTVGRGGGRANQAILAMPESSQNGRIRFTEQGEVITFRYSSSALAHRHLEQIVHAVVVASQKPSAEKAPPVVRSQQDRAQLSEIAQNAMHAYQNLIRDADFWKWYIANTPIEHISRLPIASRPVSRKAANKVAFDDLRAIPWVFAWTQTRYNLPGWFGTGAAFSKLSDDDEKVLSAFQNLYRKWPFFRIVLDNAQLEMQRAHLAIAHFYSSEQGIAFHQRIAGDYEQAANAIRRITGQTDILENDSVIKKSIALRNPYTDVLNLLQIELLQRWRRAGEQDREDLRHALFLSINGIAAAMQSTG